MHGIVAERERGREREERLVGTILSLPAFRGPGTKENGPCPATVVSAFARVHLFKYYEVRNLWKIQNPTEFSAIVALFQRSLPPLFFSPTFRVQKEGREKEGVGESVENISLLSSMMETIPNFRILLRRTNTYARARARAHRHSFQSFVSRCTRKRSSIGVACDTASCNASPESGLKAVYTRLACASFHSRRRKRRSSEKGGARRKKLVDKEELTTGKNETTTERGGIYLGKAGENLWKGTPGDLENDTSGTGTKIFEREGRKFAGFLADTGSKKTRGRGERMGKGNEDGDRD